MKSKIKIKTVEIYNRCRDVLFLIYQNIRVILLSYIHEVETRPAEGELGIKTTDGRRISVWIAKCKRCKRVLDMRFTVEE